MNCFINLQFQFLSAGSSGGFSDLSAVVKILHNKITAISPAFNFLKHQYDDSIKL